MREFRIIALTLPGLTDPSVAIAATLAGGLGVLGLTYASDVREALAAIERLARYTKGDCGIKLDDGEDGAPLHHWPGELLVWAGASRQELLAALESLGATLAEEAEPALHDLAHAAWREACGAQGPARLAIVAASLDDLRAKLAQAQEALGHPKTASIQDARGVYFTEQPLAPQGRVAFLFPGQGSQYPDMLRDLAILFPEVREAFARADGALASRFPQSLSRYVFPPPALEEAERRAQEEALTQTNVAQPALGAADMALCHLLEALGVRPDMVAGHSYGEYVALCAAGVFDEAALYALSEARGRFIVEASGEDMGTMAATMAGPEDIADTVEAIEGLWMSNLNAPRQTVISGLRPAVEEAMARLKDQGVRARSIPVACAFHSPLMAPAQERLTEFLSSARETGAIQFARPRIDVFSNTLAAPYPEDPDAMADILSEHLLRPVQFVRQVEAMYDAGARIFIEVGPKMVLTGLVSRILEGRPCLVLATDAGGRPRADAGIDPTPLLHALAQLAVHGVEVRLDRLYEGRTTARYRGR